MKVVVDLDDKLFVKWIVLRVRSRNSFRSCCWEFRRLDATCIIGLFKDWRFGEQVVLVAGEHD